MLKYYLISKIVDMLSFPWCDVYKNGLQALSQCWLSKTNTHPPPAPCPPPNTNLDESGLVFLQRELFSACLQIKLDLLVWGQTQHLPLLGLLILPDVCSRIITLEASEKISCPWREMEKVTHTVFCDLPTSKCSHWPWWALGQKWEA